MPLSTHSEPATPDRWAPRPLLVGVIASLGPGLCCHQAWLHPPSAKHSFYRCSGTTGVSKPRSEGLCLGGESPNLTQSDGNNDFVPGTPHGSVVGAGPGRGQKQRLPACCNQDYPFPEGLRFCSLDKFLGPALNYSRRSSLSQGILVPPANSLLLIQPNGL